MWYMGAFQGMMCLPGTVYKQARGSEVSGKRKYQDPSSCLLTISAPIRLVIKT